MVAIEFGMWRSWNTSEIMKAIFGRAIAISLCRPTPGAHPKVLLTKNDGAKRCAAPGSAASRCLNEPNGLKSTRADSKVWSAGIVLCVIPLYRTIDNQ